MIPVAAPADLQRRASSGALILGLSLGLFLAFCWAQYQFGYYFWDRNSFAVGNDDSFITFRYAKNFVDHGVLSFNLDDNPRVEGFSNPLHLAVSVLIYAVAGSLWLYPVTAFLGAVQAAAGILIAARIVGARWSTAGAAAALTLSLLPVLWINATSGLETASVFLVQVVMWALIVDPTERWKTTRAQYIALAVCTLLLTTLRTDGFLLPLFSALWLALARQYRLAAVIAATAAATFIAIMLARLYVYGLPMPLPYYVKISGGLLERLEVGARYFVSILLRGGLLIPFLAVLAAAAITATRALQNIKDLRTWLPSYELTMIALLCAYFLYIGGDIYRERFLLIVYPMALAILWSLPRLNGNTTALLAGTAVIILHQLSAFTNDPRLQFESGSPKYDQAIALGQYLKKHHAGAVMATGTAGKPPYFSELKTIDILGLNDRHIAMVNPAAFNPGHSKFDVNYVLNRRPDLICDHVYGDGSIAWGFTRYVIGRHGYRIAYLAKTPGVAGDAIIDVWEKPPAEIAEIIERGYRFGCARKQ